ncbi:MAG: N-carbamoyl-L-amino acid amidohydrolase [Saprospiraceae bacterium]|nr:N-carbamoyl-L-amino acid amidohydrolase [Saprospiraceae bacterium]
MLSVNQSPYLINNNRLADVIAAIQVMGSYRFYKLDFAEWSNRISGDESKADYWRKVLEEHPEFFRLDGKKEKASLVWRRQYPKRFNVDTETKITRDDFYALPDDKKLRISRNPLDAETIHSLINTAIDIHSRALQHQQDKRWWIPLIVSGIGGLVGAIIGGLLK